MIPVKLQIKNFLSYGAQMQTIDFGPYPLICLSGKNGHGKSALLDSITWALWAEARKISGVSKSDDGLVRLGQSHMMVIFDFELNKQKYRVKREYLRAPKATANLEFGIFDQTGEKLISLTEKKIRDTQKKIEDTLSLSIDTFVNSAFLRQGQANEFSKKSPKDRKDIFSQILGLQQYDIVKKLANDKSKLAGLEKDNIIKFQEKTKLELDKKSEIENQVSELEKNLANISEKEIELLKKRENLLDKQKELGEQQKNKQILLFKQNETYNKNIEEQKKLLELRIKWKDIHSKQLKLKNGSFKNLQETKTFLQAKIDTHQKTLQEQLKLKEQYLKDKELIQKLEKEFYQDFNKKTQEKKLTIEKFNLELRNTENTIKDILQNQFDKNSQKKTFAENLKKLKDYILINKINEKELEREEAVFEKRRTYYQQYIAQGNALKKELDSLEQKHLLSQHEDNPSCPLCEQNLSASRKKFLKTKFAEQKKFGTHRLARYSKLISELKKILISQNDGLKKLKDAQEKNKITQVQATETEKNIVQIDQELEKINSNFTKIKNTQKEISKNIDLANKDLQNIEAQEKDMLYTFPGYKQLLETIENNISKIRNLNYNEQEHKKTLTDLSELEIQINEFEKIKQEIQTQETRKENIFELCAKLKKIKLELNTISNDIKKYENLERLQKDLDSQAQDLILQQKETTKEKEILLHSKGALENQILKLKELESDYKNQEKEITRLALEQQDYKIISEATGKDGIQAYLIESAIPEVEQEANDILSKLTNNQSQIIIESLRDLKNGGTKETLDIKISDEAGIRPYELFSGGEAFRIDFALRIAISKLLARRAGTALQTLIIDEGFGSQDEEGLGKIMDAVYKIQEDFSKIIIVSHLNSMKDQFPVHFHIHKGPQGSEVRVIEQG